MRLDPFSLFTSALPQERLGFLANKLNKLLFLWKNLFNDTIIYFGLPNRRTCAFIYFYDKNGTCVGLLGTGLCIY